MTSKRHNNKHKNVLAWKQGHINQIIEENHDPNVDLIPTVEELDQTNFPEREQLGKQLLDAQDCLNSDNHSSPLNSDKGNKKIVEFSPDQNPLPVRACTPTTTMAGGESDNLTESGDAMALIRETEKDCYDKLIQNGGRPLYPIEMLEKVSEDPESYREMLQPFWLHPMLYRCPDSRRGWEVFQRQWERQQAFRCWQLDNRGITDDDAFFDDYIREHKDFLIQCHGGKEIAEMQTNFSSLKEPGSFWEVIKNRREEDRQRCRETGCNNFAEYHDAVRTRLKKNGLTVVLRLLRDPKLQDPLTTWYEYLGFEYWWQHRHEQDYEYFEKQCNVRFQQLKNKNLLKDYETAKYLSSDASWFQLRSIEASLWTEILTLDKDIASMRDVAEGARLPNYQQTLDNATRNLEGLRKEYDVFRKKDLLTAYYICAVKSCKKLGDSMKRQIALIRWALEQIPLIKAEMASEECVDEVASTGQKRKRRVADDLEAVSKKRPPKQQQQCKTPSSSRDKSTQFSVPVVEVSAPVTKMPTVVTKMPTVVTKMSVPVAKVSVSVVKVSAPVAKIPTPARKGRKAGGIKPRVNVPLRRSGRIAELQEKKNLSATDGDAVKKGIKERGARKIKKMMLTMSE